jgi:hypothetical protein
MIIIIENTIKKIFSFYRKTNELISYDFGSETVTGQGGPAALTPCPARQGRAGRNIFFKPCPGSPAGQGRAKTFALHIFLLC